MNESPDSASWTSALDALEARLGRLAQAVDTGETPDFEPVQLPQDPPPETVRARACLALETCNAEIERLTASIRLTGPAQRLSPYGPNR